MTPSRKPIVSIRNLTKSYANGFQALKGVTLDIYEGPMVLARRR